MSIFHNPNAASPGGGPYHKEVPSILNSVKDVWTNVLGHMKNDLSETTINTWFDELEAVDIQGNTLRLYCTNDFKKGYVESLFMKNIKAALKDIFSMDFEVVILDAPAYEELQGAGQKQQRDRFTSDEFTFETFVVGPSNKLAYSIANVTRKKRPTSKIVYIKGDEFINEFIELVRAGRGGEFRSKYREADLLLVDDVQFVAGKEQVQNEFFHTFNNLYETGRQIVLTSDRPPSEMTLLDDRLRTRFEWGLLADIAPPEFETRVAIVKNKAAILGMELPDNVAFTIANRVTANVRQLEGTVNKILAYKDLLGSSADEETVNQAMQDILNRTVTAPSPQNILSYIGKHYSIEVDIIRGQQRIRNAVVARQVAMYLIRNMTHLSLDDIGKEFDNRDHSTVLYSIQQVEKKMKKDPVFAETIKDIKTNITSQS